MPFDVNLNEFCYSFIISGSVTCTFEAHIHESHERICFYASNLRAKYFLVRLSGSAN